MMKCWKSRHGRVTIHLPGRLRAEKNGPDLAIREIASKVLEFRKGSFID